MGVKTYPIEQLVLDPACQARAEIHNDAVDDYAAALAAGVKLPPVDVYLIAGAPYVVDGFHRVTAHIKAGVSFVETRGVGSGTIDGAIWEATRANLANGLRRSTADKRKAIAMAFDSVIGREQSDRVIADWLGVSPTFVGKVRSEEVARRDRLSTVDSRVPKSAESHEPDRRASKDGRSRPATQPKRVHATKAETEAPPELVEEREPSRVELDADVSVLPEFTGALVALEREIAALRIRARRVVEGTTAHAQTIEEGLKRAESAVGFSVPVVCPTACVGPSCRICRGRGWVTKSDASQVSRTAKVLGREARS